MHPGGRDPKRLYTKESWWEVEDELKETKATNLNLRSLYGGIHDAEFLFLRVIGIRRLASRGDVVQRLRESMSSTGPLSNWTEGIDISDLEELENIQTSSYFRPADWRAPGAREFTLVPDVPAGRPANSTAHGRRGGRCCQ